VTAGERLAGDLGDRAGHLDARRTAADHHEGQVLPLAIARWLALGPLEGHEDAAPDRHGVVERLQTRRVLGPGVVAEVGVGHARGDDEGVVRQRRTLPQHELAVVESHAHDIVEQHPDVGLAAEDPADGRRDVGRRESGGGHLVEQRLEQVMVVSIENHDLHRRASERAGGRESRKASSDDDDAGQRGRHSVSAYTWHP
jgi:hypothetical protein